MNIVVDDKSLDIVSSLEKLKTVAPVVLIPNTQSYVDWIIISYLFYQLNLPVPFVASDQKYGWKFIQKVLRYGGGFFLGKREKENKNIYNAIIAEYLEQLLNEKPYLQFFIEASRSRTGKIGQAKHVILKYLTDFYFDKKFDNIYLVPITISYDNVIGVGSLSKEITGDNKIKASFRRTY